MSIERCSSCGFSLFEWDVYGSMSQHILQCEDIDDTITRSKIVPFEYPVGQRITDGSLVGTCGPAFENGEDVSCRTSPSGEWVGVGWRGPDAHKAAHYEVKCHYHRFHRGIS